MRAYFYAPSSGAIVWMDRRAKVRLVRRGLGCSAVAASLVAYRCCACVDHVQRGVNAEGVEAAKIVRGARSTLMSHNTIAVKFAVWVCMLAVSVEHDCGRTSMCARDCACADV